jgi:hypothetical protein
MMETGRNAPCPCGSGRKYKNCCLKTLKPDRDSEWQRLGEAYGRLDERLRDFAERALGRAGMAASYDEFLLWPEEALDPAFLERQGQLFCSWSIFNWRYEPEDVDGPLRLPPGVTPAEFYLERQKGRLSETEKALITAISHAPFSFHEVIRCEPGRGFLLKDVLTGEELDVLERSASEVAREGDILFGRVATLGEVSMLYGCGAYAFPPEYKPSIIDLRKWLRRGRRKITREMLGECEADIRKAYLDLSQSLFRLPTLCNTDGEPFDMQTLHYKIDSAERAFAGLAGLCVTESEAELRALAERDAQGAVTRVEIPWTRKGRDKSGLDTTVLGILNIEGKTLKVSVNSAARAERIRKEIESRLGAGARFKTAVIQSGEVMMKEARDRASRPAPPRKDEDLMRNPEVRAKLAEMVAAHWEGWVDEKIPALGGKTPRQAVKTADGRESVEALLRSAERRAAGDRDIGEEILRAVEGARRRLNLPRR